MELKHLAVAGTLESSDIQIVISPLEDGIELTIESSVLSQFGKQIKKTILEVLEELEVKGAKVIANDKGALDCTIRSRVQTAVFRAVDQMDNLPWGGVNKVKPQKNRLRRTMMFLNAHRASLVKDAYVYKPDCVIFDLEDAVSENQKDSARIQLYNTLKHHDYKGVERFVRINGMDTTYWKEDIRASVAGGCDGIRIPKCEFKKDVETVEIEVLKAEKEFGVEEGSTLLMAAIETPLGVMNAYELAKSSERIMGISIGAGDFMRTMHATRTAEGFEMLAARSQLVLAARAAGVMCFDTVHMNVDDAEGLEKDTRLIKSMGFDGKSVVSPKQISVVHKVFAPSEKEIMEAEKTIFAVEENAKKGIGVFTMDGEMVDIAMLEGAKRVIAHAKDAGVYKGEL